MDHYHPVTVLGYFLHQPITSTAGELPPFPTGLPAESLVDLDRGTENHIVTFISDNIVGENIATLRDQVGFHPG